MGSLDEKIENNNKLCEKLIELLILNFKKLESNTKTTFKETFNILNGYAFKSNLYNNNGDYKVITIKNIKNDGFTTNSCDKIFYDKQYEKVKLNIGDILLTMTGEVGRSCIVDENNCLLNQRVLKVYGNSQAYTFAYLKQNYSSIVNIAKGSVQQNLSVNDLYNLPVIHTKEQIEDFKKYDILIEKYIKLKVENIKLLELKNKNLSKFF